MAKKMTKGLAAAAVALAAASVTTTASAEYVQLQTTKYYAQEGAWRVNQHYTKARGWCAAYADYQSGERLALIGSKEGWTLRISHPKWRGLKKGARYDIEMRTDNGWGVGYRAWGYETGKGARHGLRMPTFGRALDALSKGSAVYFVQPSGHVMSSLDLTGSARAIAALRECRSGLARTGGFDGPPPSAFAQPSAAIIQEDAGPGGSIAEPSAAIIPPEANGGGAATSEAIVQPLEDGTSASIRSEGVQAGQPQDGPAGQAPQQSAAIAEPQTGDAEPTPVSAEAAPTALDLAPTELEVDPTEGELLPEAPQSGVAPGDASIAPGADAPQQIEQIDAATDAPNVLDPAGVGPALAAEVVVEEVETAKIEDASSPSATTEVSDAAVQPATE